MNAGKARERRRFRGSLSGRSGKIAGATSIAAPLIGFIVHDLKKPDSVIRGLIGSVKRALLHNRRKSTEAIDITDRVEVIEDQSNQEP